VADLGSGEEVKPEKIYPVDVMGIAQLNQEGSLFGVMAVTITGSKILLTIFDSSDAAVESCNRFAGFIANESEMSGSVVLMEPEFIIDGMQS
jgi:hypothetical protein